MKARAFANTDAFEGLDSSILGHKISSPICVAPTALQKWTNEVGECGSAAAANAVGTCFGLSSCSTVPITDVAKVSPDIPKIMQIYFSKVDDVNMRLFNEIEKNGQAFVHDTNDCE